MFWEPVTHYEVQNYLLTLNVKKACGFDDIPARLLKDAAEVCVYWVFTDVYQSDMIIYVWGPTFKRHHPKDVTQFRTCVLG